ncbi:MAG: Integral membrane protein YggT, involved in response to extracytoplasmic stress (osmotic shock) [uncultured Sulfurovum sp.]|uniref:Integral membrane protein YggT, involved in response to extracytoplasmic stress (Osmotic shock) n=1 Tax=uncultured Sulfurovum sp. TaxID=269237 RepID=A0A6S6SS41_9BACT|nr:MAG: Integral membrane protein YggT, involved in response to extracytoplasmic stress (osmotic shock) [uncultured Sulfurovum sp.]
METLFFAIIQLVHSVLNMYIWVIIIAAVLSLIQVDPRNPIVEVLNRLTQPAFEFVRKKLPFVVFSGIDLSPLVLILGLQFVDTLLVGL